MFWFLGCLGLESLFCPERARTCSSQWPALYMYIIICFYVVFGLHNTMVQRKEERTCQCMRRINHRTQPSLRLCGTSNMSHVSTMTFGSPTSSAPTNAPQANTRRARHLDPIEGIVHDVVRHSDDVPQLLLHCGVDSKARGRSSQKKTGRGHNRGSWSSYGPKE